MHHWQHLLLSHRLFEWSKGAVITEGEVWRVLQMWKTPKMLDLDGCNRCAGSMGPTIAML
jgi:hypothetical protein